MNRGGRRRTHFAGAVCALAIGCAPAAPQLPSWQRGNHGLEVGDRERVLWDQADAAMAELEKADAFLADAPLDALFADVVTALAPPLDPRAPKLSVRLVETVDRNAAAYTNGVILVSVGLIPALRDEAELAALLGHEIAHLVLRHMIVEKLYEDRTSSMVDRQKLSRRQEAEADSYAIERMAAAGYDPSAMHEMLSRLEPDAEPARNRVAAWESHPGLAQRTLSARWKALGMEPTRAAPDRYEAAISGVLLRAAELEIETRQFDRAAQAIDRHLARRPNSGRAYYLKAEVARHTLPEGHSSAAVRSAYERAVELDPEHPDALRALGLLLREAGDAKRSRDLLERYLRAAPGAVDRSVIERYIKASAER